MTRILLVGCGKMGGAMLEGWLGRGVAPSDIAVIDPSAQSPKPGVAAYASEAELPAGFAPDIVVLAVKPQVMEAVIPPYARFAGSALFLSIAAGKSLAFFEQRLGGPSTALVRAMPNTPASVGRGVTLMVANGAATEAQRKLAQRLGEATGEVIWMDSEAQLDFATGISGCGPAYVFYVAEALAAAGVKGGLPPDVAMRLARATVTGSGELLHQSDLPAATLRQNVTSPGGVTAAALEVLMDDKRGFEPLFVDALAAVMRRTRELAG